MRWREEPSDPRGEVGVGRKVSLRDGSPKRRGHPADLGWGCGRWCPVRPKASGFALKDQK